MVASFQDVYEMRQDSVKSTGFNLRFGGADLKKILMPAILNVADNL